MGENNFLPKHKLLQIRQQIPGKAHIPPNLRSSTIKIEGGGGGGWGCENQSFKIIRKRVPRDYYEHETRPATVVQGKYHSSL